MVKGIFRYTSMALPIEILSEGKNLRSVEAFDNNDELYETQIYLDLVEDGIVVHDDSTVTPSIDKIE